jgi:hypothetical protein
VKGDVGAAVAVAEGNVKGKEDLKNLERELVKLKKTMIIIRAIRPKAELLARPAAYVSVPPAPKVTPAVEAIEQLTAPKCDSTHPPPRLAPVKTSRPPARPRAGKRFHPSMKK